MFEDFYKYSGLRINSDKPEVFAIGSFKLAQRDFIHNVRTSIKILATFFDYHKPSRNKAHLNNFQIHLKDPQYVKVERPYFTWKDSNTEDFCLSKAALISVSNDLIKEIDKLIYGFIWKRNDNIKRSALINDIENGGLKMLDIESMISAQRVMALKKYLADGNSFWKDILDERFFALLRENVFFFVTSTLVNFQLIFQLSIKSVSMHGGI